jgi:acetyl-CoA carboxylase carboxyltransferase component
LEVKLTWQKEIDELNRRRELAKQMGGAKNVARQHAQGSLTVRERIDLLFDPSSFKEIGTLAGSAEYNDEGELESFTHVARVIGYGMINGRPACVEGGDFTIRGGWSDPTTFTTAGGFTPEKMAIEQRIPFIRLLNASGGSVLAIEAKGRTALIGSPEMWSTPVTLMSQVPVVSAALGSLGGVVPVNAAISHWSIMTKNNSQLFVAGPPLVKRALGIELTKEELGNYKVHAYQSGVIDNVAEDEKDAFRQIRLFLSYLPQNVWQQPPRVETGDDPNRRDEELLSIIPRDRRKIYDIHQLINHIVDKDSVFELSPFYGRSLVTVLAHMDGYPVAIISNDCKWNGGAQTTEGCEKMMRFIDFADTFHLPIIYLVDCPGFMIGPESEKSGIERKSARLSFALGQLTVPGISIILKRAYGVAGALHTGISRLNLRYAWPSGEWGSLPLEGGVMAAYRREIEAAPDPKAERIKIENRLAQLRSPFRTAEAFEIEEIIDPRDTRPLLCEFVRNAQEITATQLGPKSRVGMRP